jgi:iron(III) transport system substrate-binding protein
MVVWDVRRLLPVILAVGLAVATCSASGQARTSATGYEKVFTAIKKLHGKARLSKLASLVKAQGATVTVYTSAKDDVSAGLAKAFEDTYGVDVQLYRADTETVAEKITQEAKAGIHGGDVTELDGVSLYNLNRQKLIVDYDGDGLARLSKGANRKGWTVTEFRKFVVAWNTDRVSKGQQPKTWQALAMPRWKGKLAIEAGDFEWYGTLRNYWITKLKMKPAKADQLWAQIGKNALVVKGHTLMTQLLAAGEFDVSANSFSTTVDQLRGKGAPISRLPTVQPVVVRSNGVALIRGARHPAAAVLYLEWLTGPGQKVAEDLGRDPARRDLVGDDTFKTIPVNYATLISHQKQWSDAYDRVLSGGTPLPGGG